MQFWQLIPFPSRLCSDQEMVNEMPRRFGDCKLHSSQHQRRTVITVYNRFELRKLVGILGFCQLLALFLFVVPEVYDLH